MSSAGITGILSDLARGRSSQDGSGHRDGRHGGGGSRQQVEWYQQAAQAAGRQLDMLIDLDVGDHRTGARSTEQAVEIAEAIVRSTNLNLRGLQGYSAKGSHLAGEEGQQLSRQRGLMPPKCARLSRKRNRNRYRIRRQHRNLADRYGKSRNYRDAGWLVRADGPGVPQSGVDFPQVITVLGTVVSANHDKFVTTDAGIKSFSTDRAYPPGGGYFAWTDLPLWGRRIRLP